jgi:Glu-tRNA(Gln) amidotransferase subunit E-like FAD-binding protein
MGSVMVEIPVDEETAAALADPHRRRAIGEAVKAMVRPRTGADPLAVLLQETRRKAAEAGLTGEIIDAELAARKAERIARHTRSFLG